MNAESGRRRRVIGWIVIACALVAILAPSVWVGARYHREERAIQAIQAAGGWIEKELGGPEWLRQCVGDNWMQVFDQVHYVHLLRSTELRDGLLAQELSALRNIGSLDLMDYRNTDSSLAHLSGVRILAGLILLDSDVTDAGLVHLSGLRNLELLNLAGTGVTNAGSVHLSRFQNLKELFVGKTRVTANGIKALQAALPDCEILD